MAGPSYHGRTHLPGGTDPIPGLTLGSGELPGDFEEAVLSISDLTGYWRLGEGDEPYADTSGYDPGTPGDLVIDVNDVPAMTKDVTPGLLPTNDDGAVGFNYDALDGGFGPPANKGEGLTSAGSGADAARYQPHAGTGEITLMCLMAPGDNPNSHMGAAFAVSTGMYLGISYPSRIVTWKPKYGTATWLTSPGLASGETVMVHALYDGTNAELYVNNVLVDSEAMADVGSATSTDISIGVAIGMNQNTWWSYYYGVVDECAIWQKALSAFERSSLYAAFGEGTAEPAGYVWTADGSGGTSWEPPTIETRLNGA